MHQQPERPLTEPVAHQRPFAGMDGLLDQTGWRCVVPLVALGGQQQLAGGALGMAGGQGMVKSGADPQQPFARAEAAGVEVDLAAHGHPVVFMFERSCFFVGFKKGMSGHQRQLASRSSTSGQKWRAGS